MSDDTIKKIIYDITEFRNTRILCLTGRMDKKETNEFLKNVTERLENIATL